MSTRVFGVALLLAFGVERSLCAQVPDDPVYFVRSNTPASPAVPLINLPGKYDYAPSALRYGSSPNNLAVWFCGSTTLMGGEIHDGIYRALPIPGSTVSGTAVLTAGTSTNPPRYERFDAYNLCDPTVFRHYIFSEPERYYMYYECTPFMFDRTQPDTSPPSLVSLNHICLARSDDGVTWRVYNDAYWNSNYNFALPASYSPTPVISPNQAVVSNCQLSDNNETSPGSFQPPINGRLRGNVSTCNELANYGVGHPSAFTYRDWPTGGRQIWLYYWDSTGNFFQGRMKRVKSWDGFHFDPVEDTNLEVAADVKYFPNWVLLGHTGVWIATSVLDEENWFAYSIDGLNFIPQSQYPVVQGDFAELPEARPGNDLCVVPNAPAFVTNEYGNVLSPHLELISNEGKSATTARCFDPGEVTAPGSTWAMYYMTGIFADLRFNGDVNYCQAP